LAGLCKAGTQKRPIQENPPFFVCGNFTNTPLAALAIYGMLCYNYKLIRSVILKGVYKAMTFLTQLLIGLTDAATTVADTTEEVSASSSILSLLLPMILMFAVFYFLLIRPQRKKDKKVKDMLSALKVGDRISTIGGIYGTIQAIQDETIELTVGKDNVKLMMARWAIRQVEDVPVENDSEVLN